MPWATRGLRDGVITTRWPKRPDEYGDAFPGSIDVTAPEAADRDTEHAIGACPTQAIYRGDDGRLRLDRGRCVLCGRCPLIAPHTFAWRDGSDVAGLTRRSIVVGEPVEQVAPGVGETQQARAPVRRVGGALEPALVGEVRDVATGHRDVDGEQIGERDRLTPLDRLAVDHRHRLADPPGILRRAGRDDDVGGDALVGDDNVAGRRIGRRRVLRAGGKGDQGGGERRRCKNVRLQHWT